ncbi:AAA family ATPase [Patescibacteria group bacterium]|nr:AAA family ATPase [Patescibacteria group bacterium]MBU1952828.1 AAA family ATPase [Patescibacteria group bacterium]
MIYLIAGVPGSGKSTTANKLAQKLEKSFLIETDILRLFVKNGYASPANWTKETASQFELATLNTCCLAKNAEKFGFDVVIDDSVSIEQEKIYLKELPDAVMVWLNPRLETILERNQNREKRVNEGLIRNVYAKLSYRNTNPSKWHIINTDMLQIGSVVDKIFLNNI